jgi:hypothetical protein
LIISVGQSYRLCCEEDICCSYFFSYLLPYKHDQLRPVAKILRFSAERVLRLAAPLDATSITTAKLSATVQHCRLLSVFAPGFTLIALLLDRYALSI